MGDDDSFRYLERLAESPYAKLHSAAASLLNSADPGWLGRRLSGELRFGLPHLGNAYLEGALATGVQAWGLDVSRADLSGSDWSGSRLHELTAIGTSFRSARPQAML